MKTYKLKSDLCLELAVGGPLQVFNKILRKYMYKVDINEQSRNQMLATYENDDSVLKSNDDEGKIGDRF
jgi:hypothetical protein